MRKSINKGIGYDDPGSREDQILAAIIIALFVTLLAGLPLLFHWGFSPKRSSQIWPYEVRSIDLGRFEGDTVIQPVEVFDPSSTITLKMNNGDVIVTDLTSEDIINQLSLDYADLYDYYGGAEELY